ncbi:MAG: type II toxin-antitoxin system MqsA family antitoxin [Butyrivibrio sp.]|nr:type II toxin-antitoxin system MqsA family antitoxin [Butyrivibrio sp.]
MRCIMCKGSIVQTKHTYIQEFEDCIIIIKNVPALVCSQCGEVYYSDEISDKLEETINRLQNIVRDIAIFEYDKVVEAA